MGVPAIPETIDYVKRILDNLPAGSPLKQALPKSRFALIPAAPSGAPQDSQFDLESAPATSFWLVGNDGGK